MPVTQADTNNYYFDSFAFATHDVDAYSKVISAGGWATQPNAVTAGIDDCILAFYGWIYRAGGVPDAEYAFTLSKTARKGENNITLTSVTNLNVGDHVALQQDDATLLNEIQLKYESHTIRNIDSTAKIVWLWGVLENTYDTTNGRVHRAGEAYIEGTDKADASIDDTIYIFHDLADGNRNFGQVYFSNKKFKTVTQVTYSHFKGSLTLYEALDAERLVDYDVLNAWGDYARGSGGTAITPIHTYSTKENVRLYIGRDSAGDAQPAMMILDHCSFDFLTDSGSGVTTNAKLHLYDDIAWLQLGRKVGDWYYDQCNIGRYSIAGGGTFILTTTETGNFLCYSSHITIGRPEGGQMTCKFWVGANGIVEIYHSWFDMQVFEIDGADAKIIDLQGVGAWVQDNRVPAVVDGFRKRRSNQLEGMTTSPVFWWLANILDSITLVKLTDAKPEIGDTGDDVILFSGVYANISRKIFFVDGYLPHIPEGWTDGTAIPDIVMSTHPLNQLRQDFFFAFTVSLLVVDEYGTAISGASIDIFQSDGTTQARDDSDSAISTLTTDSEGKASVIVQFFDIYCNAYPDDSTSGFKHMNVYDPLVLWVTHASFKPLKVTITERKKHHGLPLTMQKKDANFLEPPLADRNLLM